MRNSPSCSALFRVLTVTRILQGKKCSWSSDALARKAELLPIMATNPLPREKLPQSLPMKLESSWHSGCGGDRYQVLVVTHLDRANHLHSHFVVNTVSFVDGIKYHRTKQDYKEKILAR